MENFIIESEKFNFSNKKLNKEMDTIKKQIANAQKGSILVAKSLTEIKDGELWRDDFDTFDDCIATFNIGRAQAYRVISAYKLKTSDEIDGRLENYNITQVQECARLDVSLMCDVIDRGEIKETMSCKDIRDVVDSYKKPALPVADEVTDDTDETTDDTDETTDDTISVYLGKNEIILNDKDYNDLLKWLTKREYI